MPFSRAKVITLDDDTRDAQRKRWIIALALALALNEVLIGYFLMPKPEKTQETQTAQLVIIDRPTPTPKPKPTPKPTPPPVKVLPIHAKVALVAQTAARRAAGLKAPTHGGSPRHARAAAPNLDVYKRLAAGGLGRGHGIAGTGAGGGAGAQSGGGDGGNGTGSGTAGDGTGAINATTPCGQVTFNIKGAPRYDNHTAYENVNATVSYPDGHTATAFFPYKWVYPDGERTDPWSNTNLKNPDFEIPAQLPPADMDPSTFDPIITYILKHTSKDGITNLVPCPGDAPPRHAP